MSGQISGNKFVDGMAKLGYDIKDSYAMDNSMNFLMLEMAKKIDSLEKAHDIDMKTFKHINKCLQTLI